MQELSSQPARKVPPIVVFLIIFAGIWIVGMIAISYGDKGAGVAELAQITMANYHRIQTGMTYSEVCEILGKPGVEMARNELAGIKTELYSWQSKGPANMNVMFQNGRMVQKAQFGLK